MQIERLVGLLLALCCNLVWPLAASTGPDDRSITDPKSVISSSNLAARPVPVDDLYSSNTANSSPVPHR
jgi:hypothetical protein